MGREEQILKIQEHRDTALDLGKEGQAKGQFTDPGAREGRPRRGLKEFSQRTLQTRNVIPQSHQ